MTSEIKTGVLLTNLGSPDEPTAPAVRRFLKEFLSDPLVIQLPRWLWLPLLNLVILNIRPPKVAHAYQSVWTDEGSPLLSFSKRQREKLQNKINLPVALGMRYGNPSLKQALQQLHAEGVERIIVLPLYPQFSITTTQTSLEEISRLLKAMSWQPQIKYIENYCSNNQYIEALANSIKIFWSENGQTEKLLLSFHGLPQRYVDKGDPYFEQCHVTAKLLAEKLQLNNEQWQLAFQSRFGREEWIKPYTDFVLQEWGQQKVKSVAVVCPGFPSDCLETLEEIALQNKEIFQNAGGGEYHYIPALNDSNEHITVLSDLINEKQ
ncbi:MAG: ferrochelatase [Gammaproteobacteria bacterium]|nr:ferrochelatase [Gammaproteobacteria bacterium]MDH5614055.1 ferrochelatase [Gammaproteobacteria bacterium]